MQTTATVATAGREQATEDPVPVAQGLFDAWNAHDIEAVLAWYAPDYEGTDVGQPNSELGIDGKRESALRYFRGFPDLQITTEQVVAQGDTAVINWVARGTHKGAFMGIPPTGRAASVRGMSLLTVREGKVVKAVYVWDVAGMLREIGLLPEL